MSVFSLRVSELLHVGRPVFYNQFRTNRPNIQRPRPPSFIKSKFLVATQHREPEDFRSSEEKCLKPEQRSPAYTLDALDKIYASEVRDLFATSKLVAVFARYTTEFFQFHAAKVLFFKANMKVVMRSKYIIKDAIKDTEFRNLLPLFEASNFLVFCPEPDIEKLVAINKKLQNYTLLGAVAHGQILSVPQLESLACLGSLENAQSILVQTLLSGPQSVAQSLQSHQNTLVQQLKLREEQLQTSS